jgi:hypothetical protein
MSSRAKGLYRSIFRAHKELPLPMKELGNAYVRSEFKLHKASKPEFLNQFFEEWEFYLQSIKSNKWRQTDLDDDTISSLSAEQKQKLIDLKESVFEDSPKL